MDIPVDAHGFVLSRATYLPGGSHTAVTRRCTTSRQSSSSRSARRGRPRAAARATRHLRGVCATAGRRRLWWQHPGRGSPPSSKPSSRTLSCAHRSRRRSRAALIDHSATRRVSGSTVDGSPRYPLLLSLRLRAGAMGSARGRSQETSRHTWPAGPRGRSPNAAPPQSAPALLRTCARGRPPRSSGRGADRYASSMHGRWWARAAPPNGPWRHTPWRAQTSVGWAFMF